MSPCAVGEREPLNLVGKAAAHRILGERDACRVPGGGEGAGSLETKSVEIKLIKDPKATV